MNIDTAMNCLWAEVARYNDDSRVREAWQTLKAAVSEQTAHNKQMVPCPECGRWYQEAYVGRSENKCPCGCWF